jgi:hypothetical protein
MTTATQIENVAQKRLNAINESLDLGRTVLVRTATRTYKITPKTAAKWKAAGNLLFKVSGNSLYMASGSKFVCIDYTTLTAVWS